MWQKEEYRNAKTLLWIFSVSHIILVKSFTKCYFILKNDLVSPLWGIAPLKFSSISYKMFGDLIVHLVSPNKRAYIMLSIFSLIKVWVYSI
jgi:hypothetical protein